MNNVSASKIGNCRCAAETFANVEIGISVLCMQRCLKNRDKVKEEQLIQELALNCDT